MDRRLDGIKVGRISILAIASWIIEYSATHATVPYNLEFFIFQYCAWSRFLVFFYSESVITFTVFPDIVYKGSGSFMEQIHAYVFGP